MNYDQLYSQIINDLKAHKRALIKLTPEDIEELKSSWSEDLEKKELHKILCILDHCINPSLEFEPLICRELQKNEDTEGQTLIFLLGAAQKHIIEAAAKNGYPPSGSFMSALTKLLDSRHVREPETFEWLLRTIEQTGMKSILFRKAVLKNKPGLGSIFNQHKKACKEIIELLEKRWAPIAGGTLGK